MRLMTARPGAARMVVTRSRGVLGAVAVIGVGVTGLPPGPVVRFSTVPGGSNGILAEADSTTDLNTFPLVATSRYRAASGQAHLSQPWSPFGISVSSDGRLLYDLTVDIDDLPTAAGDTSYVVWLATPSLDRVQRVGVVRNGVPLTVMTKWTKLLVVITAEPDLPGDTWAGPIVLSGRARSALMRPLWGHSLFRRIQM